MLCHYVIDLAPVAQGRPQAPQRPRLVGGQRAAGQRADDDRLEHIAEREGQGRADEAERADEDRERRHDDDVRDEAGRHRELHAALRVQEGVDVGPHGDERQGLQLISVLRFWISEGFFSQEGP